MYCGIISAVHGFCVALQGRRVHAGGWGFPAGWILGRGAAPEGAGHEVIGVSRTTGRKRTKAGACSGADWQDAGGWRRTSASPTTGELCPGLPGAVSPISSRNTEGADPQPGRCATGRQVRELLTYALGLGRTLATGTLPEWRSGPHPSSGVRLTGARTRPISCTCWTRAT